MGAEGVWGECVGLGRCLLPLVDVEKWRQESRREGFRGKGIGVEWGEFVFGVFAGIVFHSAVRDAVAEGAPCSIGTLDAVSLRVVSDAVSSRADWEFLAGLPDRFADEAEEKAVLTVRLCVHSGARAALQLAYLAEYLTYALRTVTARTSAADPTCGDLRRWVREGLDQT